MLTIMLSLALSTGLGGLMMTLQIGPVAEYATSTRVTIGQTNLNSLCVMFDIGIVTSLYLIWSLRSPLIRVTLLLLIPFSIIAVLMTKSRAGLAVLPLGIVVGATLGLRGELGRKVTLLCISLLAVGGVFLVAEATGALGADTLERWTGIRGAAQSRWYIVKTGLQIIKEHPVLGTGYGMFGERYTEVAKEQFRYGAGLSRDPHNSFLSVTAELGPTGLFVFTAMMLCLVRCGLRVRAGPEAMFVLAVVVMLGLTALKGTLWSNKYFYYAIALVVVVTRMYPKQARYGYALPPIDDEVGGYWGRTTGATPYRPVG
jgi:O-antigen ligase